MSALEGDRRWDAVLDTSAYLPADVTRSTQLLGKRVGQYVLVSTISVYAKKRHTRSGRVGAADRIARSQRHRSDRRDVRRPQGAVREDRAGADARSGHGRAAGLDRGSRRPTPTASPIGRRAPIAAARSWRLAPPPIRRSSSDVRDLAAFLLTDHRTAPCRHLQRRRAGRKADHGRAAAVLARNVARDMKAPASRLTWVACRFPGSAEGVALAGHGRHGFRPRGEYAGFGRISSAKARGRGTELSAAARHGARHAGLLGGRCRKRGRAKPKAGIDPVREAEVLKGPGMPREGSAGAGP
jgi:2'-hydroxyisoflavone reductase